MPQNAPGLVELTNYPNPFNRSTVIRFTLPIGQAVRLTVYNILGQEVAVLLDETLPAGEHEVAWSGNGASSGVYFYRLVTESEAFTRKMMLLK